MSGVSLKVLIELSIVYDKRDENDANAHILESSLAHMATVAREGIRIEEDYADDENGWAMPAMNALAITISQQEYPSSVFRYVIAPTRSSTKGDELLFNL